MHPPGSSGRSRLAACFGFAFDGLRARFPRYAVVSLGVLAVLALVVVPFLFAAADL